MADIGSVDQRRTAVLRTGAAAPGDVRRLRVRAAAAPVLLAVLLSVLLTVLAGCGGDDGRDEPPEPSELVGTLVPDEPSDLTGPTDEAPEEPADQPAPEPEPEPDEGLAWAVDAEVLCAEILQTRGSAPLAESGDLDDDMALYADWRSAVLAEAAAGLASITAAPTDGEAMVAELTDLSALEAEAVEHYLAGAIISERLDEITAWEAALAESVHARADRLGTPSCGALVD